MSLPRTAQALAALLPSLPALLLAGCAAGLGLDDQALATRVKARFAEDAAVAAMHLSVRTEGGVVQLSGSARSQADKDKAGALARGVADVREVRNDIVVRPPG